MHSFTYAPWSSFIFSTHCETFTGKHGERLGVFLSQVLAQTNFLWPLPVSHSFCNREVADLRTWILTLEFLEHLPHTRDAAHRLQLQGDGLWFQSCDSFASGNMQSPQVSVWSPGAYLPCTSHPTLIQKWNIPGQDSSHSLERKRKDKSGLWLLSEVRQRHSKDVSRNIWKLLTPKMKLWGTTNPCSLQE